jgi:hypothetical protein
VVSQPSPSRKTGAKMIDTGEVRPITKAGFPATAAASTATRYRRVTQLPSKNFVMPTIVVTVDVRLLSSAT